MPEKIYFYLLILCGLLSQGIIGTVGDEIKESSDILLRQKRVVSYVPGEDVTTPIPNARFIVIIRENMHITCVGSILSNHVVITIPRCVQFTVTDYQIVSGTSRTNRGNTHQVTDIRKRFSDHPIRIGDGVALLTVNPPFVYGLGTSYIPLYLGSLRQGTLATVSGWGFNFRCSQRGTSIPKNLRSIQVPILSNQDCINRYAPSPYDITEKEICTYHELKHCGHTDGGAPLVVDRHLVGVHLWTGPGRAHSNPQYPDVFARLQHPAYVQWITSNMHEIEAQFLNH